MHHRFPGLIVPTFGACLALVFAACAPVVQEAPAVTTAAPPAAAVDTEPVLVHTVEGISEYRLPNGMQVVLFPDESRPQVTVNVTYFVGSRHEQYGETGMAHLLEHLLFKGTPDHPNIPQELTERGARPNGTTWYDRTNYFETFPASDDNLEWALRMEADRMINSFVRQEDLDSEMTVVRNEFEMGENSPFRVLMQRTLSGAFLWHNYGNSTIGARSDIENVSIDRLRAFYRRYYQPDNAMLVIAGRFDEARALELVRETFARIPRPDRVLEETYTREPVQDGEREVVVRRVGDVQLLNAAYRGPSGQHEDFAALDLLVHVLGDTPSGRLHRALVETETATSAGAFAFQLREPGPVLFFTEMRREQDIHAVREIFLRTIESAVGDPPTEEEVERARRARLRQIEMSLNHTERIALGLSEWASMGDWRLFFLHRDRLRDVSRQDVARVARTYLKPANRTLGMFIPTDAPDRAGIPDVPDVAAMLDGYTGDATVALGEAFDPAPENIEARVQRYALDSGFHVSLLPKRTRGESVRGTITLLHGTAETLWDRREVASMAMDMLMRGTETRTRQEIRDELDELKATVWVAGAGNVVHATIETERGNLPAVLDLVGEVLSRPAFDESEFRQLKQQRLAQLEESRTEPNAIGSVEFQRRIDPREPGDPLYVGTFDEQIAAVEAVTLDDLRAFHREFFGATYGTAAVVGDFDEAPVREVLDRYFGTWTSPHPYERIVRTHPTVPAQQVVVETPDKANAFFMAGLNIPVGEGHADYPALLLANYMMGGGFLNSRLATRIRQQDGLSYGVGSQLWTSPQDPTGRFSAFAIYAPENADRLETAFREEIARAREDGFTAEEFEAARNGYLESRQMSRGDDGVLARELNNHYIRGRTFDFDAQLEERIRQLTADDVTAAFRRHVNADSMVVVRAGDFEGAAAAGGGPDE